MKTDARVRYTKMVIQESFFKLIKEKPINKITVKSICELSEINRATFYKYYTDPFDLMRQIENEFILEMQKLIEKADNEDITQTLVIILEAIKQNDEMYMLLISENWDSTFINRLLSASYKIKKSSIQDLLPNMTQTAEEWLYHFMTHGCMSILIFWIQNGMKEEPLEVAQFINRINNKVLKGLLHN
jgi:AcrR family transcriptional regulator